MHTLYNYFLFTLFYSSNEFHHDSTIYSPLLTINKLPPFTIHGLWAERYDHTYPQWCNKNDKFDINKIKDLVPTLEYVWHDYMHNNSEIFWKHEWLKHGTCTLDILPTERDYFLKALELYSNYNIYDIFEKYGISNGYYPTKYIDAIINITYGKHPNLVCEKEYLSMIELCIAKNFSLIDCNMNKCGKYMYIKSYNNLIKNDDFI